MKARFLPTLVGVLLPCVALGGSYSLSGALGGGYTREDDLSPIGSRNNTTWDWEADAAISGTPLRPGLLRFLAGAHYRALRSLYFNSTSLADALSFDLSLAGLSDSPVALSFGASRAWSDFSTVQQETRTGISQATRLGGSASFRLREYPSLSVSLFHSDVENHSFGSPVTNTGNTTLSIGAGHSTKTQEYTASYASGWNSGTFAETNYRSHAANLSGSIAVSDDVRLRFSERYYLRLPTVDATINPRYDDNAFGAGLQWHSSERVTSSLGYTYSHLLATIYDAPNVEHLSHSVTGGTTYRWNPDLSLQGNASYVYTAERFGSSGAHGSAETLGVGASWRKVLRKWMSTNIGGGFSFGLAEPIGSAPLFAYGVAASGGLLASGERIQGNLNYNVSYDRNTSGLSASMLSQSVTLTVDGAVQKVLVRGAFTASGARRDDPLMGTSLGRSAGLSFGGYWKRLGVQLGAGVSDGLAAPLLSPGISDGFFLPASFDTHTRYASLTASAGLGRAVTLVGMARTMEITAPLQPNRYEDSASLSLNCVIGLVTLSLEERVSSGGVGPQWQTGNLVMLRAMRTFGMAL